MEKGSVPRGNLQGPRPLKGVSIYCIPYSAPTSYRNETQEYERASASVTTIISQLVEREAVNWTDDMSRSQVVSRISMYDE